MQSITFGEFIKKKRLEKGMPIRAVASAVGLDQSMLSKIERNKLQAPARVISGLAVCLGFDYEQLQKKYWSERIYNEMKEEDFGTEATALALEKLERYRADTKVEQGKEQLLTKIRAYLNRQPVERAWLFGSFARDEAGLDSDIDLLVRFERSSKVDLFDYIGIKQDLEDLTGRQVDLVEEGQEKGHIKPSIHAEKKLIYERQAVK